MGTVIAGASALYSSGLINNGRRSRQDNSGSALTHSYCAAQTTFSDLLNNIDIIPNIFIEFDHLTKSGNLFMSSLTPTLKQLLIADLPPGFVRALLERIENIYPESYTSMFNNPSLCDEQAKYVLGHYRRGLAETVLMNTAAEHGLKVRLKQPENGGCKHVYVTAGRFGFVMCHVPTSGGLPKPSDSREQSSKINEHISQGNLFPVDSEPSDEEFYGVFVHTEQTGKKDIFKSLCIGFPTPEFDDWIEEPIDLQDIIDIQQRLFQNQEDAHAQIQKPEPMWKNNNIAKTEKGDEN